MAVQETASVRMHDGDWTEMVVCGQGVIVVSNGTGCFGARLTPSGWVVITEPMRMSCTLYINR